MSSEQQMHRREQRSVSEMRGLQAAMGGLSAQGVPAEAKCIRRETGFGAAAAAKAIAGAASTAYNYGMWMSASYVADRCKGVLAVCGERLDPPPEAQAEARARVRAVNGRVVQASLKKSMARLERALREDNVRLHAWVENTMSAAVVQATRRLTGVEDLVEARAALKTMKSDALAVNFDAYLEAMQTYERQKHEDFGRPSTERGTWRAVKWVMRTDEALGYTTVADKLETFLAVCWYDLETGLRSKVERLQQALRNAESSGPQEGELSKAVRLVVWVAGQGQYNALKAYAVRLATTHSDPVSMDSTMERVCRKLRVRAEEHEGPVLLVLAAFFEAFEEYKARHPVEFSQPFEVDEQVRLETGVLNLDEALGYVNGR
jgi:hypothetical protein